MENKKPAWSYSALTAFETCPRRYYLTRVSKEVPDPMGEAAKWGNVVHKHLENRVANKTPLPPELARFEPVIAKLETTPGQLSAETKYTLDYNLKPTTWFAKNAWVRSIVDLQHDQGETVVALDWKGLPLDTPIPTPSGFVYMRDLAVGDAVFGSSGAQCFVVGKSTIMEKRCFRVTFDDTSDVVCDFEHLWKLTDGRVVPAENLRPGDMVAVAGATETRQQFLPIDPYVFGLWLADGKHSSGEVAKPDDFVWEEVRRRGYEIGGNLSSGEDACRAHTIKGIRGHLTALGVLKNKFIPKQYLFASRTQRLDLLRGLMDGDGNANPTRKQAVFTTTSAVLSASVKVLLASLGQRVNQAVTKQHGFGLEVTAYPLAFRPLGINPFLLPRKADLIDPDWGPGNSWRRKIVAIEEVDSVPTQCISVDSPDNTYLCTEHFIPTHNTGKPKPDSDQLELFAATIMHHKPAVQQVKTAFVWLQHNRIDKETYTRGGLHVTWGKFLPRVERMNHAYENARWPAKPSGLCRSWCPCKGCEFNGK